MKKRGNRNQLLIATKVGKLENKPGLSPSNIISACEDSLKRLGSDYIDIYYSHQDDLDTPIEQTLEAYDSLIKSGKVRYIAASNFTPARLQESLDIAKKLNFSSYIASQDQYNLMDRDYENTLMPTLKSNGFSQIPFYGLAPGFLTGKYRKGQIVESIRASGLATNYANDRGWTVIEK
jgi:aryl-alcohol dehydrogenase-like predicted oxidoreductase